MSSTYPFMEGNFLCPYLLSFWILVACILYLAESAMMNQGENSVKRFLLLVLYVVCERGHLRCQGKKLAEHFSVLNVSIILAEGSLLLSLIKSLLTFLLLCPLRNHIVWFNECCFTIDYYRCNKIDFCFKFMQKKITRFFFSYSAFSSLTWDALPFASHSPNSQWPRPDLKH